MTDLLPCPFCGSQSVAVSVPMSRLGESARVQCEGECGATIWVDDGGQDAAVSAWNRRAPDEATRIATAEACARIAEDASASMKAQGSMCADREFRGATECAAEIATAIRLQQGSEKP